MQSVEHRIIAIDPGPEQSAVVDWNGNRILNCKIAPNEEVFDLFDSDCPVYCEMIASYGMPVGKSVFETCLWIGEFRRACKFYHIPFTLVYRQSVKLHHCGSVRAKDANVRQVLIDKYGAKGTKSNPGVTYQLKSHLWQALAIATMVTEGGLK